MVVVQKWYYGRPINKWVLFYVTGISAYNVADMYMQSRKYLFAYREKKLHRLSDSNPLCIRIRSEADAISYGYLANVVSRALKSLVWPLFVLSSAVSALNGFLVLALNPVPTTTTSTSLSDDNVILPTCCIIPRKHPDQPVLTINPTMMTLPEPTSKAEGEGEDNL